MMATLAQIQADLPRLLEVVNRGEDVLIMVEGQPKARLTKPETSESAFCLETQRWMAELAELRNQLATGKMTPSAADLVDEDRNEREAQRAD